MKNYEIEIKLKESYEILNCYTQKERENYKDKYRKLAKGFHPDRNFYKSKEEQDILAERFKEIHNAYSFITENKDKNLNSPGEKFNYSNRNYNSYSKKN